MSDDTKDTDDKEKLPDLAQAEQALFFGEASIGGPAWFQEAAQSQANFAQRLPGTSEWTIGNGVGSLDTLTREERAEKENDEAAEWFDDMMDKTEREQQRAHEEQQERERAEWARASHSYAGIEMTGQEWGEFADQLKGDTPLRKWLLEKLKKEGKTDAKATEMVDQMALLAKMQNLPKNQWTDEMKALDTKLDADPALREELNRDMNEGKKYISDFQADGKKVALDAGIAKTDTTTSALAGADILSQGSEPAPVNTPKSFASTVDGAAIASTLDLGQHHKAALAATEPLDAPKQIAAATPPPAPTTTSPGGGFDV